MDALKQSPTKKHILQQIKREAIHIIRWAYPGFGITAFCCLIGYYYVRWTVMWPLCLFQLEVYFHAAGPIINSEKIQFGEYSWQCEHNSIEAEWIEAQ